MKGMILAAGLGTRLRPLTWTVPKPMVPLCNRPLVDWAVESFLDAGVEEIVVNLHHLPGPIETHLRERYASRTSLQFSFEDPILGTGGALRRVRPLLAGDEPFFLVNGDTLQLPRYDALLGRLRETGALAALTLRHPPANDRFTAVWLEGGRLTGFGSGRGEPLMFAGSHAISGRIFEHMPDEEVFGIVDRVYQPLIAAGETIAGVVDDGLWFDVGTPARYLDASRGMLEAIIGGSVTAPEGSDVRGDSLVDVSARVPDSASRSTVGAGSFVEGALVDSIVWSDCRIGPGARLERCIVGDGVEIPSGVELSDAVICLDHPAIPADVPREYGLVIVR